MYAAQTNFIRNLTKQQRNLLKEMCQYANNLYNYALYNIRQHYFKTASLLNYQTCFSLCKGNENCAFLHPLIALETIHIVEQSFMSFYALSKTKADVKIPHYRAKGDLFQLTLPQKLIVIKNGYYWIPQSYAFHAAHSGIEQIRIPFPKRLENRNIKIIRIIPMCNGKEFKIQYIYETAKESISLNKNNALSIDLGINNLATCVSTSGTSFIMDGRYIKSINHRYNKQIAKLRSVSMKQGYRTTTKIQQISKKRDNRINNVIKKTARYIINYCIKNDIGTLIVGYSENMKKKPNLGKINNQNFVQIPLMSLVDQLRFLCWKYNIDFFIQEEAYTSKSSFLDQDALPRYYPNQVNYPVFSGERIHRGLYKSKNGTLINADVNGSANIMRKCKQNLDYEKLCKGLAESPQRIRVV